MGSYFSKEAPNPPILGGDCQRFPPSFGGQGGNCVIPVNELFLYVDYSVNNVLSSNINLCPNPKNQKPGFSTKPGFIIFLTNLCGATSPRLCVNSYSNTH